MENTQKKGKWLPVRYLIDALYDAGARWYSRSSLFKAEQRGLLSLPRIPGGRGDRVVTQGMIEQIVRELSPGGSGKWYYENYKEEELND